MTEIHAKSYNVGKTVSTIKVEHASTEENWQPTIQVKAAFILLGGYNQEGRSIPLKKYQELKRKFDELIDEITIHIWYNKTHVLLYLNTIIH